ncbi:unnamed protein product [Caretta caretta]
MGMRLIEKAEEDNRTVITEFILLGFGDLPELQILLFLVFLVIYIVTMSGNILIIALVVADQHLHTPMYFFLGNLSCLETCYTSAILPRMLASLLTGDRTISLACTDTYLNKVEIFVVVVLVVMAPGLLILVSYAHIILKKSSAEGRRKAFSTCSSHLVVVTVFYGSVSVINF